MIQRSEDHDLYRDAYDEAQRIIRVSEEVRITLERVASDSDEHDTSTANTAPAPACPKCGTPMVLRISKRGTPRAIASGAVPAIHNAAACSLLRTKHRIKNHLILNRSLNS